MVSREVPLSLMTGVGFKMRDQSKRTWVLSAKGEECIVREMGLRGYKDGRAKSEDLKGAGTLYTFTFTPTERPEVKHVYTMSYIGGEIYIEVDETHIEETRTRSEADKDANAAGEARIDKFIASLQRCKPPAFKSLAARAPFAEPVPAGLAAAGAGPPAGWGGEPAMRRAAPAPDYGNLEEMMAKMKMGGRRRTKKQKRMRRRLTKKKRFT